MNSLRNLRFSRHGLATVFFRIALTVAVLVIGYGVVIGCIALWENGWSTHAKIITQGIIVVIVIFIIAAITDPDFQ